MVAEGPRPRLAGIDRPVRVLHWGCVIAALLAVLAVAGTAAAHAGADDTVADDGALEAEAYENYPPDCEGRDGEHVRPKDGSSASGGAYLSTPGSGCGVGYNVSVPSAGAFTAVSVKGASCGSETTRYLQLRVDGRVAGTLQDRHDDCQGFHRHELENVTQVEEGSHRLRVYYFVEEGDPWRNLKLDTITFTEGAGADYSSASSYEDDRYREEPEDEEHDRSYEGDRQRGDEYDGSRDGERHEGPPPAIRECMRNEDCDPEERCRELPDCQVPEEEKGETGKTMTLSLPEGMALPDPAVRCRESPDCRLKVHRTEPVPEPPAKERRPTPPDPAVLKERNPEKFRSWVKDACALYPSCSWNPAGAASGVGGSAGTGTSTTPDDAEKPHQPGRDASGEKPAHGGGGGSAADEPSSSGSGGPGSGGDGSGPPGEASQGPSIIPEILQPLV